MKTHSREWFQKQVADARKDIELWPEWMREGRRVATASFPQVGEEVKSETGRENTQEAAKDKTLGKV